MDGGRGASGGAQSPAGRYLELAAGRLRAIRRDLPALSELGERMARPLLAGGRLFAPRVADFWPREFSGRAGGFMGITRSKVGRPTRKTDVVYVALPMPGKWDPRKDAALTSLLRSRAQVFVNGRRDELAALGKRVRVAGFTGGARASEGLYGLGAIRPLAGVRALDQFARGWATTGEMITACIRGGKMPVIYMSVWLEGAFVRNSSFVEHHNWREPWFPPLFHRDVYIPPLPRGYAGGTFLDIAEGHLATLRGQLDKLARAGRWMAQAKHAGRRVHAVATGHSYPEILELAEDGSYPIEWSDSISDLRKAVPRSLGPGDVMIHLGYAPVDVRGVRAVLRRGIRLIHTSPYGRPESLESHRNFIWLDLPWRPADASVDVPGYSVRILPMSSTCHTMAYFAMLAEMAGQMGWK